MNRFLLFLFSLPHLLLSFFFIVLTSKYLQPLLEREIKRMCTFWNFYSFEGLVSLSSFIYWKLLTKSLFNKNVELWIIRNLIMIWNSSNSRFSFLFPDSMISSIWTLEVSLNYFWPLKWDTQLLKSHSTFISVPRNKK